MEEGKQYPVFGFSRLDLQNELGFSPERLASLSEEDLQHIAEKVRMELACLEEEFWQTVSFVTDQALIAASKGISEGEGTQQHAPI